MFRLALHLGMTVSELGRRMDSRELSEWYAFTRIEPWPEDKIEFAVATGTALQANMNRKKNSKHYRSKDFMMPIRESRAKRYRKKMGINAIKEKLMSIADAFKKDKPNG